MGKTDGLDVAEGEGESRIWNNFQISGLSDWVPDEAIQRDGEHSRKSKIYGES